jgi:membrane-bound metal-dependent hydrolase YbcI (DUF457 family)
MAQSGIHALIGTAVKKIAPKSDWLLLGILLGSIFPDMDNYAVAIATVARLDPHGLHRTFTHSLFTILAAAAVFYLIARVRRQPRWMNLGFGIGIGIAMHILLDLILWFNGVALLWPLNSWVNLWAGVQAPEWFSKLMDPLEFLFFALFFAWLANAARAHKTDATFLGALRLWIIAMVILLVIFTPLAYVMSKGYQTIFGVFYLVSITAAFIITIRMRQTIAAYSQ